MREAKKRKKRRLLRMIAILLVFYLIGVVIVGFININITNIYISGNYYLTDQQVIDAAEITDYPHLINNNPWSIKSRLKKYPYISDAKVTLKWPGQVYININERKRLFVNKRTNQLVLSNGIIVKSDNQVAPILINYVPTAKYKKLIAAMSGLERDILKRISDIVYQPNEVDDERFVLTMTDGNIVYINIIRFKKLNKYDNIKVELNNSRGILNLDYGTNFEVKNW